MPRKASCAERFSKGFRGRAGRTLVEVLVALRAGVVHVPVMVHQVAVAQDAREPAVHDRAPEDVSKLRIGKLSDFG